MLHLRLTNAAELQILRLTTPKLEKALGPRSLRMTAFAVGAGSLRVTAFVVGVGSHRMTAFVVGAE